MMRTFRVVSVAIVSLIIGVTCLPRIVDARKHSAFTGLRDRIKHIVVLMEENRSFDHLFGFFKPANPAQTVDGLTGAEYNLVNASDPRSRKMFVHRGTDYINVCDPNHGTPATSFKIFGPAAVAANNFTNPLMNGFAQFEVDHDFHSSRACGVMDMFDTRTQLPILSSLADNFVLFDRFFCSLPSSTWPNRLFFLSATSAGLTATGPGWYHNVYGNLFPQKTIFDQVTEAGGTWKTYYEDVPWELLLASLAHHPENIHDIEQFYVDASMGNLPDFAFINPRGGLNFTAGLGSDDQHPDHDVALGELLYKNVYEALRNGPKWNETLFVLTYDEHGGFYDHVPPPLNVPPPGDGEKAYPDTFSFDRLGVRIPTILISPWLPKGIVQHKPPARQKPQPNSEYDLTSIMATSRKLLRVLENTTALTARDAWAATFEHLFTTLDKPRTDCPERLPPAPPPAVGADFFQEAERPLNGLQKQIMKVHSFLADVPFPPASEVSLQHQFLPWAQKHYKRHCETTASWKKSKRQSLAVVIGEPRNESCSLPVFWSIWRDDGTAFSELRPQHNEAFLGKLPSKRVRWMTITGNLTGSRVAGMHCLDCGKCEAGARVSVSLCYPSYHPAKNRDKAQHWLLTPGARIRYYHNETLCLSNSLYETGAEQLFLEVCDPDRLQQHFGYNGVAPGADNTGDLYFGELRWRVVVAGHC